MSLYPSLCVLLSRKQIAVICCSESVLMRDFEEMEAEIMAQMEVEALP